MNQLMDSGVMLRMAYDAMSKIGVDADAVLTEVGMHAEQLSEPGLRTPHDAQEWFWQSLVGVSGDPYVGLHLGESMSIFKGQVLEYLFLSSPSFGDGLQRALNYQRLLSDAMHGELFDEGGDQVLLRQLFWDRRLPHLNECFAVAMIKFFRFVTDGEFFPTKVCFGHQQHAEMIEYHRVFRCPVLFDQTQMGLWFDRRFLSFPSAHHEPELLTLHERFASEQMAKLEKQDLVWKVSRLVGELLESGQANLDEVATRLDLRPRQLRSRLAETGTNFNQLVADYRCRLAKRLLAGTNESIDEIVYLTGFSEPSTFYRAFRRWTDMTPIEYRKRKSSQY